jgi:hypothetical protein
MLPLESKTNEWNPPHEICVILEIDEINDGSNLNSKMSPNPSCPFYFFN